MKISIASTNPCHLYELAVELFNMQVLGCYYSGYPGWKLRPPTGFPLDAHSLRTVIVYGLLKYAPAQLRPSSRKLFHWQDYGFDRSVARRLQPADFIHAMPGQALEIFRAARDRGIRTVLNHATGPTRLQRALVEPEYRAFDLSFDDFNALDAAYLEREAKEYALSDYHCAASTIVQKQLIDSGVSAGRIWVLPYAADANIFYRGSEAIPNRVFNIVYAGQIGLRKGLRFLLQALENRKVRGWAVDCYGAVAPEMKTVLPKYRPECRISWHGPVPRMDLAAAFRSGSVLVLPSLEEGFGLVVPQALACGMPCIVSDRVGAKDLIRHRVNGSIVPAGDTAALLEELEWWAENPRRVDRLGITWESAARTLLACSTSACLHGN